MTVHKTAYDTAACSGFVMKKTIDAIKVAAVHGFLNPAPNAWVKMVEGAASVENDITPFAHPILIDDDYLVVDVRSFGRFNPDQQRFGVRNTVEYQLALHRAALNAIWVKDAPSILQNLSPLPLAVYVSWISESVARRFALDPGEQYKFAILCGIFYCSQFIQDEQFGERDKLRFTTAIARAVRGTSTDVLEIIDSVGMIGGVGALCAAAHGVTGSVRLQELNVGVLFSILGGTWFGTNAKEMVAVATEHPPTWMALLVAAFNERTFKNSGITKLTERSTNRAAGQDYVRAVLKLLEVTSK